MKHRPLFLALIALLTLSASAALAAGTANNAQVNWAEHVAPILYDNCVSCHRTGQTAPMSLMTYDETRPWAKSIRKVTTERTMPPWFANPDHGEFREDPTLTEEEIDLVNQWVAAGAPAGDLEQAPEPPSFESTWKLGTPDAVFVAPEYMVPDEVEDHYQWLQVENPENEERWIKAIEVHPGFIEVVHHQLTYLAPSDATLQSVQSGTGALDLTFVGGWGPGVAPLEFAEGHGMRMPPNSTMFFQMHYHKTPGPGTGGIDQTKIGLYYHDEKPEEPGDHHVAGRSGAQHPAGRLRLPVVVVVQDRARGGAVQLHAAHAPARQGDALHGRAPRTARPRFVLDVTSSTTTSTGSSPTPRVEPDRVPGRDQDPRSTRCSTTRRRTRSNPDPSASGCVSARRRPTR